MSESEVVKALSSGKDAWDEFSGKERTSWDGQSRYDPSGREIRIISIHKAQFDSNEFENFLIEGLEFQNAKFVNCDFQKSRIYYCKFRNCLFENCLFQGSDIRYTEINNCNIIGANFSNVFLGEEVEFRSNCNYCDFEGMGVHDGNFQGAVFNQCNFKCSKFGRSNLTQCIWNECAINSDTDFQTSNLFSPMITKDKSETTKYSYVFRNYPFNWRFVRAVGLFPILGFSWTVFLGSLFLINAIGAINELHPPLLEGMGQLPIPHDALLILGSSLLLALGSTIYSLRCPEEVKSFSETEWLYEHKHPRMEYLVCALQRPIWQAVSLSSLSVGMAIGLWLVATRILDAINYFLTV